MKPLILLAVLAAAMTLEAQNTNNSITFQGVESIDAYVCYKDSTPNGEILCSFAGEPFHSVRPVKAPTPEWVPDPSAGHYDCPDGWTASKIVSLEPGKWQSPYGGMTFAPGYIVLQPKLDRKGHVISERPLPPICIQDVKP